MDRILPFFDPTLLRGQFISQREQKQTFLTPFLPHLVHVVIEWLPTFLFQSQFDIHRFHGTHAKFMVTDKSAFIGKYIDY